MHNIIKSKVFHLCMHLIREALKFNYPTDKMLSNLFKEHRGLSVYEKFILAETTYIILRNLFKLQMLFDNDIPNMIGFCWLNFLRIKASDFSHIKLIDYHKITTLKFTKDIELTIELPDWIISSLRETLSNTELQLLSQSIIHEAPLDLRVNTLLNSVNSVLNELHSFKPIKMQYSPYGIRIHDKSLLINHPLFKNGSIEVQDESSQLAALVLNPKRNELIADFCAGAGGKSLIFAMLMHNTGRVYAFDVNEKRLNNMKPRLIRAGVNNIHSMCIISEFDQRLSKLHNKLDKVYVDAPCSGLGTLRRSPELKFRNSPDSIIELSKKQLSILNEACKLVKVGGLLAYATCSIMRQENQEVINNFLKLNNNFQLMPISLSSIINTSIFDNFGYLNIMTHIHGGDSFFISLMKKITDKVS